MLRLIPLCSNIPVQLSDVTSLQWLTGHLQECCSGCLFALQPPLSDVPQPLLRNQLVELKLRLHIMLVCFYDVVDHTMTFTLIQERECSQLLP